MPAGPLAVFPVELAQTALAPLVEHVGGEFTVTVVETQAELPQVVDSHRAK